MTILLIDDNKTSNTVTTWNISQVEPGATVKVAANGLEGQAILNDIEDPPELVLLDLNMPLLNGFELLEWIQKDRQDLTKLPSFKVVIITSSTRELDREKALRFPFVIEYGEKPVSIEKLKSWIKH